MKVRCHDYLDQLETGSEPPFRNIFDMLVGHHVLNWEMASIENNFATWLSSSFAVRVNNGADGLVLTLRLGGGVLAHANTFYATVLGIYLTEATPVLSAVDKEIFNYLSPIYLQPTFANINLPPDRYPVSKRLAKEFYYLPILVSLSNTEIKTAIAMIYHLFEESQCSACP